MYTNTDRAQDQARAQLSSIIEMVRSLDRRTAAEDFLKDKTPDQIRAIHADALEGKDADEMREQLNETGAEPIAEGTTPEEIRALYYHDKTPDELRDELIEDQGGKYPSSAPGFDYDEDVARQTIQEDALEVQVRSDWHNPGADKEETAPAEFFILLCTGGPACRIRGTLDRGEPDRAWLEYQDWGTTWAELVTTGEENAALLTYAGQFYFGEG